MSERKGGIIFGVIMGALLGVLFAPKKGKDIRKQLKSEVEKGGLGTETLKQNFTQMGQEIADTAQTIYQKPEVQKQVKKSQKSVGKFMQQLKTDAEGALDSGLEMVKSKINDSSEQLKNKTKTTKTTNSKKSKS